MKLKNLYLAASVVFLANIVLLTDTAAVNDAERFWPQWRGPNGDGVAPLGQPLTEWGEDTNVRWKKPLPGLGSSTPALWGDRLYVTTAVPTGSCSGGLACRAR